MAKARPAVVETHTAVINEPVTVVEPIFLEAPQLHPVQLMQAPATSERRVVLPQLRKAELVQEIHEVAVIREPVPVGIGIEIEHDVPVPIPVPVKVPVPVPVAIHEPEPVFIEREVPVFIDRPVIETVEKIVEAPPQPVPVMVKTIHDKTVVTEDPTTIHHVELNKAGPAAPARSAPPVRSSVAPPAESSGFKWWWLLPLLCCLPLCCLPCLFCMPKKKYKMSNVPKATRQTAVNQKELVTKEPVQYVKEEVPVKKRRTVVRRVEEPESDIEVEIEKEIEKTAVVEETHVIRKEVPVKQTVRQPVRARRV